MTAERLAYYNAAADDLDLLGVLDSFDLPPMLRPLPTWLQDLLSASDSDEGAA